MNAEFRFIVTLAELNVLGRMRAVVWGFFYFFFGEEFGDRIILGVLYIYIIVVHLEFRCFCIDNKCGESFVNLI